jgi:RimJ/RimL family protein N-acetyltransferase
VNDFENVILETERLCLRPFRGSDFDDYAALCADPEVSRYLGRGPFSREQAWRHLAFLIGHWQIRGYGMWALTKRETGTFLGMTGFAEPDGWPGFELAWVLTRRAWGRGYATEAARAALDYAFAVLGKTRVISLIHPANHASIRVAERLGESLQDQIEMQGRTLLVFGVDQACRRQGPAPHAAEPIQRTDL